MSTCGEESPGAAAYWTGGGGSSYHYGARCKVTLAVMSPQARQPTSNLGTLIRLQLLESNSAAVDHGIHSGRAIMNNALSAACHTDNYWHCWIRVKAVDFRVGEQRVRTGEVLKGIGHIHPMEAVVTGAKNRWGTPPTETRAGRGARLWRLFVRRVNTAQFQVPRQSVALKVIMTDYGHWLRVPNSRMFWAANMSLYVGKQTQAILNICWVYKTNAICTLALGGLKFSVANKKSHGHARFTVAQLEAWLQHVTRWLLRKSEARRTKSGAQGTRSRIPESAVAKVVNVLGATDLHGRLIHCTGKLRWNASEIDA
ncbi:hypothetical protein DFH09DRAFT_1085505 [Mycena vulgaris]|nr:hypothetical protein DFH09DRAFT_1085505 [Mycena vulgaris]